MKTVALSNSSHLPSVFHPIAPVFATFLGVLVTWQHTVVTLYHCQTVGQWAEVKADWFDWGYGWSWVEGMLWSIWQGLWGHVGANVGRCRMFSRDALAFYNVHGRIQMVRLQPLGKTVSIHVSMQSKFHVGAGGELNSSWNCSMELVCSMWWSLRAQQAAELGEALRSLGLVLTQKELSDMKAVDCRGANWMHVIVSQDMCGRCPSLSGRGWKWPHLMGEVQSFGGKEAQSAREAGVFFSTDRFFLWFIWYHLITSAFFPAWWSLHRAFFSGGKNHYELMYDWASDCAATLEAQTLMQAGKEADVKFRHSMLCNITCAAHVYYMHTVFKTCTVCVGSVHMEIFTVQ